MLPNTVRINRGKLSLGGITEKALELNADKVVVVDRWKGGPGKMQFFEANFEGLSLIPPLIYLRGVKLQREFSWAKLGRRRIKSLALLASQSASREIRNLEMVLSQFFSIPLISCMEAERGYDALMQIIPEQQGFLAVTFKHVSGIEFGPRMSISHLVWEFSHES